MLPGLVRFGFTTRRALDGSNAADILKRDSSEPDRADLFEDVDLDPTGSKPPESTEGP